MNVLEEVAAAVDPALAAFVGGDPRAGRFGTVVGDRDRLFTIEAVYEGYLLHYGEPRLFAGMDPDLRLLAGDALYAQGLARVAGAGDLEAVALLADLITGAARAQAERHEERADSLWLETARRLG